MKKTARLLMTGLFAATLGFAFAGCPTDEGPSDVDVELGQCQDETQGCCTKPKHCVTEGTTAINWKCVDPSKAKICQRLCKNTSECATGETCEDGLCRPPGCGEDSECSAGMTCQGGSCAPAIADSAVASCKVLPAKQLLSKDAAKPFTLVAYDSTGRTIGYKGEVAWSSSATGKVTISGNTVTTNAVGANEIGDSTITATVGSTTCTATAVNYAAVSPTDTRVVVADLLTNEPIAGATVVIGTEEQTTGADGIAFFPGLQAADKTISVFGGDDHAYVTMVDVDPNDVAVYLKPKAVAGTFTGEMKADKFATLSDIDGTVRLALFGGSIPGNLIDLQLSNLIGEIDDDNPTIIKFGGEEFEAPLPGGIVIGISDTMFKSAYSIPATPGVRGIWGLGGNAKIEAITKALQPVIKGGTDNIEVGPILTGILPLLGRLQSGFAGGQEVVSGTSKELALNLDTLLRLRAKVRLPDLPTYTVDGTEQRFEGAIVLGGALHSPQGLVPLGLTAGIDAKGGPVDPLTGKETGDGKIDAEAAADAGTLDLRLAPRHAGLEPSKFAVLALAASFSGLLGGDGDDAPMVLSGLVAFPNELKYDNGKATEVTFPRSSFVTVPAATTIDGRTLSLGGSVSGTAFHRLDIGDEDTGEWFVFLPPGTDATEVEIPEVPASKRDRLTFKEKPTDRLPSARLQTVSVNAAGGALDYAGIVAFDSNDANDLTLRVDGFSVRDVKRTE